MGSKSKKRIKKHQTEKKQKQERYIKFALITAGTIGLIAILTLGVFTIIRIQRLSKIFITISPSIAELESLSSIYTDALDSDFTIEEKERSIRIYPYQERPERNNLDMRIGITAPMYSNSIYISQDPYLIISDKRLENTETLSNSTLHEFTQWLSRQYQNTSRRLIIAGNNPLDFASLICYLASELLTSADFRDLYTYIQSSHEIASQEDIEEHLEVLSPVINLLTQWKEEELLPYNWTNYERIAARTALNNNTASAVFAARSFYKSLTFNEQFHLETYLPPTGVGRRNYRLTGQSISIQPGNGPNSETVHNVSGLLLSADVQESIESETLWSPVSLEGLPLNRPHRDIVRWFRSAEDFIEVTPQIAEHPFFQRLHQVLR